ncbi:MAG: YfbM family protein [Deltaproteobacteria bacterium]|nr:YfbM family protein [Deltaproteobacteria bacterium]
MGIEFSMWQIAPDELARLLTSEDAVDDFMESRFPETYDEDYEDDGLSLEKIWHLLHYLITGDAENEEYPLAYAIMVGYLLHKSWNNLIYLPSDEVREVSDAISSLSEDDFYMKYKPESVSELDIYKYPSVHKEDVDDALEYFRKLKDYYQDAANKGNAMLRYFH